MGESHSSFLIIGYNLCFLAQQGLNNNELTLLEPLTALRDWLETLDLDNSHMYLDIIGKLKKIDAGQMAPLDFEEISRKASAEWYDFIEDHANQWTSI